MASQSTQDAPTILGPASAVPTRSPDERLSLPFPVRLQLGVSIAAVTGFALGAAHGSTESGYRFRAENAHRLPTTQTGWYLYHKSKNYHRMLGGVKDGLKMTVRLAGWSAAFLALEEGMDRARYRVAELRYGEVEYESKDLFSSGLAGMATAGAFSAVNRLPAPTAVRMAKLGLKCGLAYGFTQDLVGLMRGRRLGYAEFVKRIVGIGGAAADDIVEEKAVI